MTHPTRMVWEAAGRPDPGPAIGDGICALCGVDGPLMGRLGGNFTDFRELSRVDTAGMCGPCTWCLGGKPPRTLRMWSIVVRYDRPAPPSQPASYVFGKHLHATNRKDMRWLAATLADSPDGPWCVAVAESTQKHTLPFTTVNHDASRWAVRMDGTSIVSTSGEWRRVLSRSAVLRSAGFSAAAVESGMPPMVALKDPAGLAAWMEHSPHLAPYAGTPLLHLANFVITKETCDYFRTTYPV